MCDRNSDNLDRHTRDRISGPCHLCLTHPPAIWSHMSLSDVLKMARRRWITAVLTFLVVIGAAVFALHTQKPVYQATATVGLVPKVSPSADPSTPLLVLGQTAALLPLYSEADTSPDTRRLAAAAMPAGQQLGSVSASTFQNFTT